MNLTKVSTLRALRTKGHQGILPASSSLKNKSETGDLWLLEEEENLFFVNRLTGKMKEGGGLFYFILIGLTSICDPMVDTLILYHREGHV